MKREYSDIIKNVGTITALLTGAIVSSCSFASPLVQTVLGGVLTNILSNKLEQSKLLELRKILSRQDPANLNHNLEKLIQESIIWAVENTSFKYEAYCTSKAQKKILFNTKNDIINDFQQIDKSKWQNSEALLKQIDHVDLDSELIEQLVTADSSWPLINSDFPFPQFFENEFVPNFRLCFGELLKNKDHQEGLIAYNRNISNQIQKSIANQDEKIKQLLGGNQELRIEIQKLSRTPQERFEKEIVFPEINVVLDEYLKPLHDNVELLVDQNGEIITGIQDIKNEAKHQTQRIENLGRIVDRNLNNKYLFILLPIIALTLAYFAYKYWQSTQPFIFTVTLDLTSPNNELPKEEAQVILSYGDKIEKITTHHHEAIFKGLPSFVKGDSVRVRVSCYGFTKIDSQLVAKNNLNLSLHRDDSYAILQGRVKEASTGLPIKGAIVRVQNIETLTGIQGQFTLNLPEEIQKTEQRLIISKIGFKPWERIEPVIKNTNSIIQLDKE